MGRGTTRSVILGARHCDWSRRRGMARRRSEKLHRFAGVPQLDAARERLGAWSAAIVIGALTMRANTRLGGRPLLVLGAILLGFVIGGPPYKGCEQFQMFRPV